MEYVALEKVLDKSENSIYKLVVMVARRALEIVEGQPKLVQADAAMKPFTVALHEIAEGKIYCKSIKGS